MVVYMVTVDYGYDRDDFVGIFSTEEKANEYIDRVYGSDDKHVYCTDIELDELLK